MSFVITAPDLVAVATEDAAGIERAPDRCRRPPSRLLAAAGDGVGGHRGVVFQPRSAVSGDERAGGGVSCPVCAGTGRGYGGAAGAANASRCRPSSRAC